MTRRLFFNPIRRRSELQPNAPMHRLARPAAKAVLVHVYSDDVKYRAYHQQRNQRQVKYMPQREQTLVY